MATNIPFEYFGIGGLAQGLGQAGQGIGRGIERRKDRKLKEEEIEKEDAKAEFDKNMKEYAIIQDAFKDTPGGHAIILAEGIKRNLLPKNIVRNPTIREGLIDEGIDPETGLSIEEFRERATLGLENARETVKGARAENETRRYQNLELEFANRTRQGLDKELRNYFKLGEGDSGKGHLDFLNAIQGLKTGELANKLSSAQLRLVGRQIDKIDKEMLELRKTEDPNADFYEGLAKTTLIPPSLLKIYYENGTFDSKNPENDKKIKEQIGSSIQTNMSALRAEAQQKITEARTGPAGEQLKALQQGNKAGIVPEEVLAGGLENYMTAVGLKKGSVPNGFFASLFGPNEKVTWTVPEQVDNVLGTGTPKTPTVSTEQIKEFSDNLLARAGGDRNKAIEAVKAAKDRLGTNYEAILNAVSATEVTKPSVETVPKPVTKPEAAKTEVEKRTPVQEALEARRVEAAAIEEYRSIKNQIKVLQARIKSRDYGRTPEARRLSEEHAIQAEKDIQALITKRDLIEQKYPVTKRLR